MKVIIKEEPRHNLNCQYWKWKNSICLFGTRSQTFI